MLIDAYSSATYQEGFYSSKTSVKRIKSLKFAIFQVLPCPLSEATEAVNCSGHLQTVAAVCRFLPCNRLPSITWYLPRNQPDHSPKTI